MSIKEVRLESELIIFSLTLKPFFEMSTKSKPKPKKQPPDPTAKCPVLVRTDRVIQFGIGNFIQDPWRSRLVDAVLRAHKCFENALFLSKLSLLTRFEDCLASNGDSFNHSVATAFTKDLKFDTQYFKHMLTVVSCEDPLAPRPGRPFSKESRVQIQSYMNIFQRHSSRLPPKVNGMNLSHLFGNLANQMVVAYANNVQHFEKYLKSYIRCYLEVYFLIIHNVQRKKYLPTGVRPFMTTLGNSMIKVLLYSGDGTPKTVQVDENKELQSYVDYILTTIREQLIPPGVTPSKLLESISKDPVKFIPYMIEINRILETLGKKLKSPLPIRSHHIPGSVLIDTAVLIDIMIVDPKKEDFVKLKTFLSVGCKYDMTSYKGKKELYDSPDKHMKNVNPVKFKTHIWEFFTNAAAPEFSDYYRKTGESLIFNNTITTNGYKVGIHFTNLENYLHAKFTPGINVIGEAKAEKWRLISSEETEFTYVNNIPTDTRAELLTDEKYVHLYCDPGKGNLLCIGTGDTIIRKNTKTGDNKLKSGTIVNYTAAQRRHETGQKRNTDEYERLLKNTRTARSYGAILDFIGGFAELDNMTVECREDLLKTLIPDSEVTYDTILESIGGFNGLASNPNLETLLKTNVPGFLQTYKTILESVCGVDGASKMSCKLVTFEKYLTARSRDQHLFDEFFSLPCHRRRKFRAQLGENSSEDKLVNRISKTFNPKGDKTLVLFYGNWGQHPNMKNQAPTTGIGLRRRLAKRFQTYTVDERYTSSICPCCDGELGHPPMKRNGGEVILEIHHLLRCKNETCGKFWQRDVMAVSNFKRQVQHGLKFGENDPVFAAKYKAKKDKEQEHVKTKRKANVASGSRKRQNATLNGGVHAGNAI